MAKELISILYVFDRSTCEDLESLTKSNGFSLIQCSNPDSAGRTMGASVPDLIMADTGSLSADQIQALVDSIKDLKATFKPTLFFVMAGPPGAKQKQQLNQLGADRFVISPVTCNSIKDEYRVYRRVKDLEQQIFTRDAKLEKSFSYLDQFKKELKTIKNTLFEERETLNNTLKQVNQMTAERKRLKKELALKKTQFSTNIDGFTSILSTLVETRVEKNRGHGERVSHIAHFIAKHLQFDTKKLEDLRKAAMLHEVGLLLVPEALLHKTDEQLSSYEKDLLTQYPGRGADFFLECSEFKGCADIIRNMNENSDGTGRPNGLKRRYIPLMSRILAGADVFDTLKDHTDVTSLDVFLEKLEQYAGTRLDPNIVAWLEKYAVLHMGSDAYQVRGVGIHQLEPGMTLGTALFTHTGTKLFSVNTLLTADAIDKIKNYDREYPVDETVYIRA